MADVKYEIVKSCGIISEGAGGRTKEVNLIRWEGKEAKLDLRSWPPGREIRKTKGISFTIEEAKELKKILNSVEL